MSTAPRPKSVIAACGSVDKKKYHSVPSIFAEFCKLHMKKVKIHQVHKSPQCIIWRKQVETKILYEM